jgi:hypothetical protein
MIDVVMMLLVLHGADGREIRIAPSQVTSLQSPKPGKGDKLFAEGLNCMVNLSDGKYVAVIEPCAVIQRMLEEAR